MTPSGHDPSDDSVRVFAVVQRCEQRHSPGTLEDVEDEVNLVTAARPACRFRVELGEVYRVTRQGKPDRG